MNTDAPNVSVIQPFRHNRDSDPVDHICYTMRGSIDGPHHYQLLHADH